VALLIGPLVNNKGVEPVITDTASQLLEQGKSQPIKDSSLITTGLSNLDQEAGGLAKGLVLLAGRPSICHEALAKYIALKVAVSGNRKVIWFTTASSGPFLMKEFLKQGCNYQDLIKNNDLIIVDTSKLTVDMIRDELDDLIPEWLSNQGLVIVDDLEVLLFSSLQEISNQSRIAGKLRSLGLERNFTLIARCILSRKLEYRKYKQPRLSDLKKYRHFVIEADQVIAIHYPHIYNETEPQNHWEWHLLKNRNGLCWNQYFTESISTLFQEQREGNEKASI
jgi:replicative DNA helicase